MVERDILQKIIAYSFSQENTMREREKCNDYSEFFYEPIIILKSTKRPTLNHPDTKV